MHPRPTTLEGSLGRPNFFAIKNEGKEVQYKMASTEMYTALQARDHIETRSMWAGALDTQPTAMILFKIVGAKLLTVREVIPFCPALYKCFDEPIVNALDQAQRCARTTEIGVDYDGATGRITVWNNGDGIPVQVGKHTDGKLIPQFIFGTIFSGSNMKSQAGTSTLGGINGIGVKLTNIHSHQFCVETYDSERKKSFKQEWRDGMRHEDAPIVADGASDSCAEGTRITFALNYERFKIAPKDFEIVAFSRVVWAAFYLGHFLPKVAMYWNGRKISYALEQFARAVFAGDSSAGISIDVSPGMSAIILATNSAKKYSTSIVNGILVPKGNHIKFVLECLRNSTREILAKGMRVTQDKLDVHYSRMMGAHLAFIVLWKTTGAQWTSQSKDSARFAREILDTLRPSQQFVMQLSQRMADEVLASLHQRASRTQKKMPIDKYSPARYAGTRQSMQCRLFLAEGDSAQSQICAGISRVLSCDYYGSLSLNGVIPNVRKILAQKHADERQMTARKTKLLMSNKFISSLCQVLQISFAKSYESDEEIQTLAYGGIIICVDQDLDGIGNICSLVLNMFHALWPALFNAGYIQRLETPIIRAYPQVKSRKAKVCVVEFYEDAAFKEWERQQQARDGRAQYHVRYYKGLGTHNSEEVAQMMRGMDKHLITYHNDDISSEEFEVYLGTQASLRRERLSQAAPSAQEARTVDVSTSAHLRHEAHAYQIDNLARKIPQFMDGLIQVSRKILDGSFKVMSVKSETKVEDLQGQIAPIENYHHGGASMQDAITRRGFIGPGGNQLPMFLPQGQFGTRNQGGQDAASARYIMARFNFAINSIIYNIDDYPLLELHVDEGKVGEPRHFAPIIPMVILEHVSIPAHGWNVSIWAREVIDVLENLRTLIRFDGQVAPTYMRPCCYPCAPIEPLRAPPTWDSNCRRLLCDCTTGEYQWRGYIIEQLVRGTKEVWSLGTYKWIDNKTIIVTELPLCVWSKPYADFINELESLPQSFIKKSYFAASEATVDIRITFAVDSPSFVALGLPCSRKGLTSGPDMDDALIRALHLRSCMSSNINVMMPDCSVRTFDDYESLMREWFTARKLLYPRRIARQRAILEIRARILANIIRLIDMECAASEHHFAKRTEAEISAFLESQKFDRLYAAFLESPEMKREPDVTARVLDPKRASYDYLTNLRECDMSKTSRERFAERHQRLLEDLRALDEHSRIDVGKPFIGAGIWLEELDELEKKIVSGRTTNWKYQNVTYSYVDT